MLTVSSGYGIVAGQNGVGLQKADGSVSAKQQFVDNLLPADPTAPDPTSFETTDIVELSVAAKLNQLIPSIETLQARTDNRVDEPPADESKDEVEAKEESKGGVIYPQNSDDAEKVDDANDSGNASGTEEPGDTGGTEGGGETENSGDTGGTEGGGETENSGDTGDSSGDGGSGDGGDGTGGDGSGDGGSGDGSGGDGGDGGGGVGGVIDDLL